MPDPGGVPVKIRGPNSSNKRLKNEGFRASSLYLFYHVEGCKNRAQKPLRTPENQGLSKPREGVSPAPLPPQLSANFRFTCLRPCSGRDRLLRLRSRPALLRKRIRVNNSRPSGLSLFDFPVPRLIFLPCGAARGCLLVRSLRT